jgi:putative membrane protein
MPDAHAGDRRGILATALLAVAVLLAWSGLRPYDRATWLMEVAPVLLVVPVLLVTYRRFPLTSLLYGLVFAPAAVLIVGGAYTYARVPVGFALADLLGTERNPYDKIGRCIQGFVPAIAVREIAGLGASVSLLLLSRLHDRQMRALGRRAAGGG